MPSFERVKENYWLQFALLLAVVFILVGKPVPYSNEFVYLLRLIKPYHADFLLNDFIFSQPANEHWFFNHGFGLLTYFFSIEVIAWVGRIACWTALIACLLRLGRLWKIPLWMVSAAVFLWLCIGQSIVADEWIIGGFEAKALAYICLILALQGFVGKKDIYPAALLGLSFSLHPAVGLWAIPATIAALAAVRVDLKRLLRIAAVTGAFSLFGLIPLISSQLIRDTNTSENWRFFELIIYPHHMDPFSWARSSLVFMVLIMVFSLMLYLRNKEDNQLKFLTVFLSALFIFFVFGILFRALDLFEPLKLMPMRLFAVFAPLFLLFGLARAFRQGVFAPPAKWFAVIGVVCLLAWSSPLATGFAMIQSTYREWNANIDDTARTFIWLRENTPNGTIVLAPPWRKDFWYLSHRAQVVSFAHTPISGLDEWQRRLREFVGESTPKTAELWLDERKAFYNLLTPEQASAAAKEYGATYFVSESEYPFPIVFQSGKARVYRLSPNG